MSVTVPRYSVCSLTTPHNSTIDDIEQIARTGGQGVGLFEGKLADGEDDAVIEALEAHGLRATMVLPKEWTILYTPLAGPDAVRDPKVRTELICESIPRLARFNPVTIVVGPGVSGQPWVPAGPIEAVYEGLALVADVAAEHGMRIGFELLAGRRGSPLPTLPGLVEFIDGVGRDNVGVLFDVYHSWCEPDLHKAILEHAHRIDGVHVNDIRPVERSWCDRVLPGDGRATAAGILASLIEAGYDGWYELEVFSDDGTFGNAYPDSLWAAPHEELLRDGKAAFDRVFAEALRIAGR